MKLIAQISELKDVFNCNPVNYTGCPPGDLVPIIPGRQSFTNLADIVAGLLTIAIYISAFLAFFWLVWGAFSYIYSGGDKENLAKARARIRYAIIGLIIILLAYTATQWAEQFLKPLGGTSIQ